jgi:hypothetical protein
VTYPHAELYEEMAFIAYYLHWPVEQVLGLEHGERRRWVGEVSRINQRLSTPAEAF